MVKKIGFVVEGDSEVIILNSSMFQRILIDCDLVSVGIHNAKGQNNFFYDNTIVSSHIKMLIDQQAEKIILLYDLEDFNCYSIARNLCQSFCSIQIIAIAKKAFEAWYLADTECISRIMGINLTYYKPEETADKPYEYIKSELMNFRKRGPISKVVLAGRVLLNGFDLYNSANHKYCNSAQYFLNILKTI